MKVSFLISCISLILILDSCWVQEAPRDTKREVRIVSDFLTGADSALINDFGKTFKVKVSILVLSPDTIFSRFQAQKYNSGTDVLITENESLRNRLKQAGMFRKLGDKSLFSKTDRQFYSSHQLWLGLAHNPLVLVKTKDSSGYCSSVNWTNWHTKDSLRAQLKLNDSKGAYFNELTENFPQLMNQKLKIAPGETIYTLSKIVSYNESKDTLSPLPRNACYYYLVHNKHYVSGLTTASVCKYSPNATIAEAFIKYLNANSWSVANGRNQLAVNKDIQPNWYIQNLKVQ